MIPHECCLFVAFFAAAGTVAAEPAPSRPNILWLTSEDHNPHMGCYGDAYATTPNVDRLAAKGMIYTRVWSNAPVCAPARTTLISGMFAPSTGGEHMRSMVPFPSGKKMFPQYLRESGYYCTNNSKEDYNLAKPGQVWDESSKEAHWKNRPNGIPFFSVFNSLKSHESRMYSRPHVPLHDPDKVRVPAYHPDAPEVRRDWAQYYDGVTAADADAGARLEELERAGLTADTIVFYFADHGSGMPRSKRSPCHSGLHVPLVLYVPEKWRHLAPAGYEPGGKSDRVVSFVDFAPTALSLAEIAAPDWMQGRAFLGKLSAPPQEFAFGFRGRMDERSDLSRSATDGRYVYVRQYLPYLPYGQHVAYMFLTPTTRFWKALHDAGKLTPVRDAFWNPKPPEELYDLRSDPDETVNLAESPAHREALERLRKAQREWSRSILDLGYFTEGERFARSAGRSPFDVARDGGKYDFARVSFAAELASMLRPDAVGELEGMLADPDSGVRYWAAMGLRMRGREACEGALAKLRPLLEDPSPAVRVAVAESLGMFGSAEDGKKAIDALIGLADCRKNDCFAAMAALNALDALGPRVLPFAERLRALPGTGAVPDPRYAPNVPRLLEDLKATLK